MTENESIKVMPKAVPITGSFHRFNTTLDNINGIDVEHLSVFSLRIKSQDARGDLTF